MLNGLSLGARPSCVTGLCPRQGVSQTAAVVEGFCEMGEVMGWEGEMRGLLERHCQTPRVCVPGQTHFPPQSSARVWRRLRLTEEKGTEGILGT